MARVLQILEEVWGLNKAQKTYTFGPTWPSQVNMCTQGTAFPFLTASTWAGIWGKICTQQRKSIGKPLHKNEMHCPWKTQTERGHFAPATFTQNWCRRVECVCPPLCWKSAGLRCEQIERYSSKWMGKPNSAGTRSFELSSWREEQWISACAVCSLLTMNAIHS